jgi:hypothetical protein
VSATTDVWFHTATAILQCVPMFGDMDPCRRRYRPSWRRCRKAQQLNGTINGEGDHEFLQNFIVIINGQSAKLLLVSRALLLIKFQLSILSSIQRMVVEQYRVRVPLPRAVHNSHNTI